MSNHEEQIAKYIENLKDKPDAEGTEAKIYFVGEHDEYVLKILNLSFGCKNCSSKYGANEKFPMVMSQLKKNIKQLQRDGINTPQIIEYGLINHGKGVMQVVLEERADGSPVFMVNIGNLQGEENKRLIAKMYGNHGNLTESSLAEKKLIENMNLYNLINQQKLLDAPNSVLEKFVRDIKCLRTEHSKVPVDAFCENLLYDGREKLSFIDLGRIISKKGQLEHDSKPGADDMLKKIMRFLNYRGNFGVIEEEPAQLLGKTEQELAINNDELMLKAIKAARNLEIFDYPIKDMGELEGKLHWYIYNEEKRAKALNLIKNIR